MQQPDHDTYRQWLELEVDGRLTTGEYRELLAHVERCADCRAERETLARLGRWLTAARVETREGFPAEVMAALPAAGWEARHPASWRWLAALAGVLALGAALLASGGALGEVWSVGGLFAAVLDLFKATAITGAGLLGASWRGIGLAIRAAFESSLPTALAAVALVIGLNLLLFLLLRRRARARAARRP